MARLIVTRYKIHAGANKKVNIRIAVLADLHSRRGMRTAEIFDKTAALHPDLILLPGDTFEVLDGTRREDMAAGLELLQRLSALAPTYLSLGNHENGGARSWNALKWARKSQRRDRALTSEIKLIRECGVTVLDDEFAYLDGVLIGGLTSGFIRDDHAPRLEWLDGFCAHEGPRILMCHHPEYYEKYLKDARLDLVVSGHAHGGQWRIFGRGVFAPGQGFFPRYTSGVHGGVHVISRGLKRARLIPRLFNPPEIVFIDLC